MVIATCGAGTAPPLSPVSPSGVATAPFCLGMRPLAINRGPNHLGWGDVNKVLARGGSPTPCTCTKWLAESRCQSVEATGSRQSLWAAEDGRPSPGKPIALRSSAMQMAASPRTAMGVPYAMSRGYIPGYAETAEGRKGIANWAYPQRTMHTS